jgi:hypothetical protein
MPNLFFDAFTAPASRFYKWFWGSLICFWLVFIALDLRGGSLTKRSLFLAASQISIGLSLLLTRRFLRIAFTVLATALLLIAVVWK